MRVLVTGAGGVIASGVVQRLLSAGHQILATDARPEGLEPLAGLGAEVEEVALPSDDLSELVARWRPEVVVHAAAIVHNGLMQEQPALGFRVNAASAVDLLDAAAAHHVRRFVFLSSRAVYGLAPGGAESDPPVHEDEPLDPRGVYDVCKVAVEGMGRNYSATTGMEFTALRFATIFGPGKTARHSNASLFSRIVEESWAERPVTVQGDPAEAYDLVYVDDVRGAIYRACTMPGQPAAAYNVGSGRITTLGELIAAVERAVPAARITLTGSGQALPLRYRYPLDITRAAADLGYAPSASVDEAVARYLEELADPPATRARSVAR